MLRKLMLLLAGGVAILNAPVEAEQHMSQLQHVVTASVDVYAQPGRGNRLSVCHLTGHVILWVSRRLTVLDGDQKSRGEVDAGLAQFGKGSRLAGCAPDGAALDLSDRFANFLIADGRFSERRTIDSSLAEPLASQLARNLYHLTEPDGALIPLVDGIGARVLGSVLYRFTVLLVHDPKTGSIDAIIVRETQGAKFAPRLSESDRRASTLQWSSFPENSSGPCLARQLSPLHPDSGCCLIACLFERQAAALPE